MDKPKRSNTITIKINGENQTFQENQTEMKPTAETPSIPKVVKIHPNIPDEEVFHETAAAQEPVDESFDWMIPESTDAEVEERVSPGSKSIKSNGHSKTISFSNFSKKKPGRTLSSIIISALFAVLIGTAIGILMLKLVVTETGQKPASEQAPAAETINQGTAESSPSLTINSFTTYVIQGGIFSTKIGAKQVSNQLSAKGIPSETIDMDGKQVILLGTANSKETAKLLSSNYIASGADGAFVKPLVISEKRISKLDDKDKRFVQAIPDLYPILAELTSTALTTKTIGKDPMKKLADLADPLTATDFKDENVKELSSYIKKSVVNLNSYENSKETKDLTAAQQDLLDFLAAYYRW